MESSESQLSFLFSSPRSGSTWLTRCLNRHPEVVGTEFRLFGEFCEVWRDPSGAEFPRQTLDHFCRFMNNHLVTPVPGLDREANRQQLITNMVSWLPQFMLKQTGKRHCVDKITPYLGTSPRVLRCIRDYCGPVKLIHLVRDGRDVLISGAFDTHSRMGTWQEPLLNAALVREWAGYWQEPQQAIAEVRWPELQRLTIAYESMLTDMPKELKRIFEFLGQEADEALCREIAEHENFARVQQRRQGDEVRDAKARKGIAGDWKNYLDRESAEQFAAACQGWLEHYGYAADSSWLEECPAERYTA